MIIRRSKSGLAVEHAPQMTVIRDDAIVVTAQRKMMALMMVTRLMSVSFCEHVAQPKPWQFSHFQLPLSVSWLLSLLGAL